MMSAADGEQFELAASYRDRIRALESLRSRQKVLGEPDLACDIFAEYLVV